MKWVVLGVLAVALFAAPIALAQQKPEYDMGKMQMVFLTRSAEWNGRGNKAIQRSQRDYVNELLRSGKCAMAGDVANDPAMLGILVFKIESAETVKEIVNGLPAVKAGLMKAELLGWYAARNVIKTPQQPLKTGPYIFGLLVRGDKWTPGETEESKKIQDGHMANINRLAGEGKLVLAGPFFDGGDRRGVFVFKVGTRKEAMALTNTDPAVIAGRLKIELFDWNVPLGILP